MGARIGRAIMGQNYPWPCNNINFIAERVLKRRESNHFETTGDWSCGGSNIRPLALAQAEQDALYT